MRARMCVWLRVCVCVSTLLRRGRVPVPGGLCQRHLSEHGGLVHLQDVSPGLRGVLRRGAL